MSEQPTKRRRVEKPTGESASVDVPCGEREPSPDIKPNPEADALGQSPSPTRVSPSPNLTPHPPVPETQEVTRSRPPSQPMKEDISPVRVPYSQTGESRSKAREPSRASLELPVAEDP